MSGRHKLHDGTGVIASDETGNKLIVVEDLGSAGGDAPADGTAGYAKGCLIFNSGAADDDIDAAMITERTKADKKRVGGRHRFVLARRIGAVDIVDGIADDQVRATIDALQARCG